MNATVAAPEREAHLPSRLTLWTGRVLTALPILMMSFSAFMKFRPNPQVVEQMVGKFGYAESAMPVIGVLELSCVLLYAIPRTSVLGAVLVTGYLGGAIATHVRIGDPQFVGPLIFALCAWAGIYLRDARLRALLPIRRTIR